MGLTIHWAQGMAANSPFAHGLVTAQPSGKLNIAAAMPTAPAPAVSKVDRVDAVASAISKENFLAIMRDNLLRLEMKDSAGEDKDIEPLLNAFANTIKQLEAALGKSVADKAMNDIAQAVESGGASEANLTATLSSLFNSIAIDPTLKGKHIELTQKITGEAPAEDSGWVAGGLLRLLNGGTKFGTAGEDGLAKALSDFYYNDQLYLDPETGEETAYSGFSKKFILNYNKDTDSYGMKFDTIENNSLQYFARHGEMYSLSRNFGAHQGQGHTYLKSDWELASIQAAMMTRADAAGSWHKMTNFSDSWNAMMTAYTETLAGILGGSVTPNVTEKMLAYEEKYLKYHDEIDRAMLNAYQYDPVWQISAQHPGLVEYRTEPIPYASEEDIAAAREYHLTLRNNYTKELEALKEELFAEFLAKG